MKSPRTAGGSGGPPADRRRTLTRSSVASHRQRVLDFDPNRTPVTPRPAATIILLREVEAEGDVEICVMQRSNQSSFMGGAVVFPGGRIESHDQASAWDGLFTPGSGEWWDAEGSAARIAACREALEEVGVAPIAGALDADAWQRLRAAATAGVDTLRATLRELSATLDLAGMVPFARWLTPEAEQRRFDARFFLAAAPRGVEGSSDQHEATRVYWSSAAALLAEFDRGAIALFPPTHRTLQLLAGRRTLAEAFAVARDSTLAVICPRFLVENDQPVLALPGDPKHEIREPRIGGSSRYLLRDGRWVPGSGENLPS